MSTDTAVAPQEKARERRLRRLARSLGLRLEKSHRRNPEAADYGTYWILNPYSNHVEYGDTQSGFGLDLDEVEECLKADLVRP